MKQNLIFAIILLFTIGITLSTASFVLATDQPINSAQEGHSVIYYIKLLNANLVNVAISKDIQPAIQSEYPIIKYLLPKEQPTEYVKISVVKDSTTVPISIPVFSEKEVNPFYCARYIRLAAQQLFGDCYPSADSWDLRYKTTLDTYLIQNESLTDLVTNGKLKEGMIVGVHNPISEYNDKLDSTGKKVLYTHVVIYIGKSTKGELLFSDLYSNEIRVLSQENLLSQFTPIEILSIKTPEGVNRSCSVDLSKVITREDYYNNLLEFIKFEESGRGSTGVRKLLSKMWEGIGGAKSYGPYQMKISMVRSLVDQDKLTHIFGSKKSSELTDTQIIDVLTNPVSSKQLSLTLLESNEQTILNYNKISSYVCNRPEYGSQDRYALEGSAYNSGINVPIIAGFEYSLSKARVDYNSIPELARFDGRISEESKRVITAWAPELTLDFGEINPNTKIYSQAFTKLLNNQAFMKKFFEEYNKNTGETCIPLFIPYKDIAEIKLIDGINYGFRVVNQKK